MLVKILHYPHNIIMAPVRPPKPTKPKKEKKTPPNEDDILAALAERELKGTSFRTLALLHKVPKSTLVDRAQGGVSRMEGHRHEQKLTPAMEKSLRDWCTQPDDWGFPLDWIFFRVWQTL